MYFLYQNIFPAYVISNRIFQCNPSSHGMKLQCMSFVTVYLNVTPLQIEPWGVHGLGVPHPASAPPLLECGPRLQGAVQHRKKPVHPSQRRIGSRQNWEHEIHDPPLDEDQPQWWCPAAWQNSTGLCKKMGRFKHLKGCFQNRCL